MLISNFKLYKILQREVKKNHKRMLRLSWESFTFMNIGHVHYSSDILLLNGGQEEMAFNNVKWHENVSRRRFNYLKRNLQHLY